MHICCPINYEKLIVLSMLLIMHAMRKKDTVHFRGFVKKMRVTAISCMMHIFCSSTESMLQGVRIKLADLPKFRWQYLLHYLLIKYTYMDQIRARILAWWAWLWCRKHKNISLKIAVKCCLGFQNKFIFFANFHRNRRAAFFWMNMFISIFLDCYI